MSPTKAPFGTWRSSVSAQAISQGAISVPDVVVDPITGDIYHLETRPSEQGRLVIVDTKLGKEILPAPFNARSKVQEYGGAAITAHNGTVYFTNFNDTRVYAIDKNREIRPITPDSKGLHRFAAVTPHPLHNNLLLAILEDHTPPNNTPSTVRTTFCLINATQCALVTPDLISGSDFYAQPHFSPDGKQLIWTEWHHPDMPWTGAEVWVADLQISSASIQVLNKRRVGGSGSTDGKKIGAVCALNPAWVDNCRMILSSDQTGYHNLYTGTTTKNPPQVQPLFPEALPYDFAEPMHQLGWTSVAVLSTSYAVSIAKREGRDVLFLVNLGEEKSASELECPYVVINNIRAVPSSGLSFVFTGVTYEEPTSVVLATVTPQGLSSSPKITYQTLKSTSNSALAFPKALISAPQAYALPLPPLPGTSEEAVAIDVVHVLYYPPTNPDYEAPDNEKPPCVVNAHGGPTAVADPGFDPKVQYWTSRGWGWLDVNYRGSSGYGRAYMCALAKNWGVTDSWDTYQAAKILANRGIVDGKRCFIRGGSAGGYTVLCALTEDKSEVRNFFAGSTSLYGISDVALLAVHTHKFESRYMDWLLGVEEYKDEKERNELLKNIGKERSPILKAQNVVKGCLILQGSEDAVVPPSQSILFVKKIKEIDPKANVKYVEYEGEGHGFRKSSSIQDSLQRELKFYASICGLELEDAIDG
jgi:acetyl esterase/lipase